MSVVLTDIIQHDKRARACVRARVCRTKDSARALEIHEVNMLSAAKAQHLKTTKLSW